MHLFHLETSCMSINAIYVVYSVKINLAQMLHIHMYEIIAKGIDILLVCRLLYIDKNNSHFFFRCKPLQEKWKESNLKFKVRGAII